MTTIVDAGTDAGDSRRIIEELAAEAAAQVTPAKQEPADKGSKVLSDDPRFAGKSREDILDMYRNLESHQGRLANELGQQRRTLDQLLLSKRASDLQSNGQDTPTELTAAELLERPTEAVSRVVDSHTRTQMQPLEQRLNSLEQALSVNALAAKHGNDWATTVQGQDFQTWAAKTPLRMAAVARARQGDITSADALLTEFKDSAPPKTAAQLAAEMAQQQAGKVGLESVQAGSDGGTAASGKIFRKQDLWALRVNDPDKYDSDEVQAAIMKAYAEGRVR